MWYIVRNRHGVTYVVWCMRGDEMNVACSDYQYCEFGLANPWPVPCPRPAHKSSLMVFISTERNAWTWEAV